MQSAPHESDHASLAALSLPKTRIRGVPTENAHGIGGRWPISSTSWWGCGQFYDGTASARVVGHFYPYGQEKPSATQNGTEKFTGYLRDAETGLDYADQRYHNPGTGRFLTPDLAPVGGHATDPGSWNRYAYTSGDPVNGVDPSGLDDIWCKDASFCGGLVEQGGGGGDSCTFDPVTLEDDCQPIDCFGDEFLSVGSPCYGGGSGGGGGGGGGGAVPTVTSLDITMDCWLGKNPKTGRPSRDQQFTAFEGTTNLTGDDIVITESVSTSPGGTPVTGLISDPTSSGSGGVFNDQKGLSFTQGGTYTLYQSFTVSVDGGTPYSVPIVLANGTNVPYLTYTLTSTYTFRHWWNYLFGGQLNYDVIEYGQGKSSLPPCP